MFFLLLLSAASLFAGLVCLGISKIKKEKNLTEWGEALAYGSIFPFLIIFMCIL